MAVMTLVTPILNEIITTLITRTLTMRAQSMLIMTMMPIHTCTSIPVIMMDSDNSEDVAVNGDTDLDSFGTENSRINNAGIDNADDDIDANEYDDGDADSNDFCDPNDTDAQHEPVFLSNVVHSFLAIDLYAFMGMTLLWDIIEMSSRK